VKEFARLILVGLEVPGITEDWTALGVAREADGSFSANVIGLALIGKVGPEEAAELFEKALVEGLDDGPASNRINSELGLNGYEFSQDLVVRHSTMSAREIAEQLQNS